MKKHILFIFIVIGVLAFQFCAEGYFSFSEKVETQEELCEISKSSCRKILRQDSHIKGISNQSFHVFSLCLPVCRGVVPEVVYPYNPSIILSKIFNHSPPVMKYFSV